MIVPFLRWYGKPELVRVTLPMAKYKRKERLDTDSLSLLSSQIRPHRKNMYKTFLVSFKMKVLTPKVKVYSGPPKASSVWIIASSQWQQFCATKRFNFHALETSPVHFSSWQGPIFCGTACSANCKNHNFYLWRGISFLFLCDSAGSLRTGTRVLSSSKNLSKYLLDIFPFFSSPDRS